MYGNLPGASVATGGVVASAGYPAVGFAIAGLAAVIAAALILRTKLLLRSTEHRSHDG
ncbi:hypothetical protein [Microbacterium mangrovi]|uniref:hypothetical protein n=1 Tax=Microbacterium mangrovi TaxID=1348253 RepID=UPI000A4165E0|nr:hypothetical protein [Microbacterium mangrovi]